MDAEKKQESFSVSDKRRFVVNDSGSVKKEEDLKTEEKQKASEAPPTETKPPKGEDQTRASSKEEQVPLPEIDFSTFILSLSSNAIFHLGLMENPHTKKIERNLPMAKQTIDIITMLKDKTKGNLSNEEENLIENLLTDLRLKYVNEINK